MLFQAMVALGVGENTEVQKTFDCYGITGCLTAGFSVKDEKTNTDAFHPFEVMRVGIHNCRFFWCRNNSGLEIAIFVQSMWAVRAKWFLAFVSITVIPLKDNSYNGKKYS